MSEVKIELNRHMKIRITAEDGGFIESQSVEANLLFAILEKLEEVRCGLIDIEDNVAPDRDRRRGW